MDYHKKNLAENSLLIAQQMKFGIQMRQLENALAE